MLLSNEFINKTHFQKKAYERFKKTKMHIYYQPVLIYYQFQLEMDDKDKETHLGK